MSVTRTQSGAALLVAMIMIFMLSVLGISAMRGANLERRMTENAIQSATSFQLAESAGELLLNDRVNLGLAFAMNGDALAIDTGFEPGEDCAGVVHLILAGDGEIAIDVECLDISVADVTRPYLAPSGKAPEHALD